MKVSTSLFLTTLTVVSFTANSLELFNNKKNTLDFNGNLSVYYIDSGDTTEINDGFSRYTFDMTHQLKNDWQALAKLEWGIQISKTESSIIFDTNGLTSTGPTSDTTWLRLGYVGFEHEKYGRFTVGKQWGLNYDVAGVTDWFEVFGAGGQGTYNFGTDGGFSGSGRAEQAIQYKVNYHNFTFGAQYLVSDEVIHTLDDSASANSAGVQFDNAYAFLVQYQAPYDIGVAVAYNQASISLIQNNLKSPSINDKLLTANITYRPYNSQGLHVAIVYTDMENHEMNDVGKLIKKSQGLELFSAYRIDDVSLIFGYNALKDTSNKALFDTGDYYKKYFILSAKYFWSEDFYFFIESKLDNSNFVEENSPYAENATAIGMMFTF